MVFTQPLKPSASGSRPRKSRYCWRTKNSVVSSGLTITPPIAAAVKEALACCPKRLKLRDRKSTRLNSSHSQISYAVFCLKKKKKKQQITTAHARTPTTVPYQLPYPRQHTPPLSDTP